jgi:hypothetical protein
LFPSQFQFMESYEGSVLSPFLLIFIVYR